MSHDSLLVPAALRKNLPGPLSRLVGKFENETNSFRKVHRLIDTFEWIIIYHTVIALSCLKQSSEFSTEVRTILSNKLNKISLGTWHRLYTNCCKSLKNNNSPFPKPKGFNRIIQNSDIISFRNEYAHGATPSEVDCLNDCNNKFPALIKMITLPVFQKRALCFSDGNNAYDWQAKAICKITYPPWNTGELRLISSNTKAINILPLSTVNYIGNEFLFFHYNSHNDKKQQINHLNYPLAYRYKNEDVWDKFSTSFPFDQWKRQRRTPINPFEDKIALLIKGFHGREDLLDELLYFCKKGSGVSVVWGAPGMGKSSLIASLAQNFSHTSEKNLPLCFTYFISRSTVYSSPTTFLRLMCKFLAVSYGVSLGSVTGLEHELFDNMTNLLSRVSQITEKRDLLLLIDGLDEAPEIAKYIPESTSWLKVIVSSRRIERAIEWANTRDRGRKEEHNLQSLTESNVRAILYDVADKYQSAFTAKYVQELHERSEGNPLFLKFFSELISSNSGHLVQWETIPKSMNSLFEETLHRLTDSGRKYDSLKMLRIHAISFSPLSTPAIAELMGVDSFRVKGMLRETSELLEMQDNPLSDEKQYRLFHESLRKYLSNSVEAVNIRLEFLNKCINWDSFKHLDTIKYSTEFVIDHLIDEHTTSNETYWLEKAWLLINNDSFITKQIFLLGGPYKSIDNIVRVASELAKTPNQQIDYDSRLILLGKRYQTLTHQSEVNCLSYIKSAICKNMFDYKLFIDSVMEIPNYSPSNSKKYAFLFIWIGIVSRRTLSDSSRNEVNNVLIQLVEILEFNRKRNRQNNEISGKLFVLIMLEMGVQQDMNFTDRLINVFHDSELLLKEICDLTQLTQEDIYSDSTLKLLRLLTDRIKPNFSNSKTMANSAKLLWRLGNHELADSIFIRVLSTYCNTKQLKKVDALNLIHVTDQYLSCGNVPVSVDLLWQSCHVIRAFGESEHRNMFLALTSSERILDKNEFFTSLLSLPLRQDAFQRQQSYAYIGGAGVSLEVLREPPFKKGFDELATQYLIEKSISEDKGSALNDLLAFSTLNGNCNCKHNLAVAYLRFGNFAYGYDLLQTLAQKDVLTPAESIEEADKLYSIGFEKLSNHLYSRTISTLLNQKSGMSDSLSAIIAISKTDHFINLKHTITDCHHLLKAISEQDYRITAISKVAEICIRAGDEETAMHLLCDDVFSRDQILTDMISTEFGSPMKDLANALTAFASPLIKQNAIKKIKQLLSKKQYLHFREEATKDFMTQMRITEKSLSVRNVSTNIEHVSASTDIKQASLNDVSKSEIENLFESLRREDNQQLTIRILDSVLSHICDLVKLGSAETAYLVILERLFFSYEDSISRKTVLNCIFTIINISEKIDQHLMMTVRGFMAETEIEEDPEKQVYEFNEISLWFILGGEKFDATKLLDKALQAAERIESNTQRIISMLMIMRTQQLLDNYKAYNTYKIIENDLFTYPDIDFPKVLLRMMQSIPRKNSIFHTSGLINTSWLKSLVLPAEESRSNLMWFFMQMQIYLGSVSMKVIHSAIDVCTKFTDLYIQTDVVWDLLKICTSDISEKQKVLLYDTAFGVLSSIDPDNDPEESRESILRAILDYLYTIEEDQNRQVILRRAASLTKDIFSKSLKLRVSLAEIDLFILQENMSEAEVKLTALFSANTRDYPDWVCDSTLPLMGSVLSYCKFLSVTEESPKAHCILNSNMTILAEGGRFAALRNSLKVIVTLQKYNGCSLLVQSILTTTIQHPDFAQSSDISLLMKDVLEYAYSISQKSTRCTFVRNLFLAFSKLEISSMLIEPIGLLIEAILKDHPEKTIMSLIDELRISHENETTLVSMLVECIGTDIIDGVRYLREIAAKYLWNTDILHKAYSNIIIAHLLQDTRQGEELLYSVLSEQNDA